VNIQADEKFSYGKKIALGVGIRAAKYPHIVVTDADCMPTSRDWVSIMAAGFKGGKEIVIGHSPYERVPGFSSLLERYDGFTKAIAVHQLRAGRLSLHGRWAQHGIHARDFFRCQGFAASNAS
jgi:biofilm PGA synthesis N-glycosyltransferase PgaC